MNARPANHFLVVEDDLLDVKILTRGLKKVGSKIDLVHKSTCEDALDFLRADAKKRQMARPFVILLDFNLPGMNAIDFLGRLRALEGAESHYVIVFTTSQYQKDIDRAYAAGANAYVLKPTFAEDLTTTLESLVNYLKILHLPSVSI